MKRLEIIIPHDYLVVVNELLHRHKVGGMSFYDVKGRGKAKWQPASFGGRTKRYAPEFGYSTKIEVVVSDTLAKTVVRDVKEKLGTGSAAFGKIFVYDVKEAYDLKTMKEGDLAL
ncbi:MAG TPA: P-II family nitrogen regulator [Nitrososphaera sp.]|jgi:nitrogen regulatory protein P-II 1